MTSAPCMWMRGGTSKGGYFLKDDLPADRDDFLLRVMGSPDPRQIDGMGGAHPLTSKVAVIGPPSRPDADVEVFVDTLLAAYVWNYRLACNDGADAARMIELMDRQIGQMIEGLAAR